MKKLLTLASAFALLFSCAKEEVVLNPQSVETGDAITFTVNADATKAEYQKEPTGWETYWYSEEDHVALLFNDATISPSGSKVEPLNVLSHNGAYGDFKTNLYGWATQSEWSVGTPVDMPKMTFKATRTEKQGVFTGINDANRLFFPVTKRNNAYIAPSFRMYYPSTLTAQFDADEQDPADDGTPSITLTVPADNVQYQNDLTSSSSWAIKEGLMLPSDPSAYDVLANAGTGRSANNAIPLNLKRQFAVLYTALDNYDASLFGKLMSVKVEAETSDIAYNSDRTVDIYQLVDGKYPIAQGATKAKSVLVEINSGTGIAWANDANIYVAVDPFTSVAGEEFYVTYTFENITITKTLSRPEPIAFEANEFYDLQTLDFNDEPYYVLSTAGVTPYKLVINPCFYDYYEGIDEIFRTELGLDYVIDLDDNNVAVAEFAEIVDNATVSFDAAETAKLELLTAVEKATYVAASETMIPEYPAITELNMANLLALDEDVVANLNNMTSLTDLILTDLEVVPAHAFESLTNLTNVQIPSAKSIGELAFGDATGLIEMSPVAGDADVLISDALTTIGKKALYNMAHLETAILPGVTTIGEKAFFGCSGLKELALVSIENNNIADDAFGQTQVPYTSVMGVETLIMPKYNFSNTFVRSHLIKDNFLAVADLSAVTDFYEKLDMVSGVKLENYTHLTDLVIADGAKLHTRALKGCTSLVNVNLEDASLIDVEACMNCSSLEDLVLNVNIGANAFNGCTKVTSISFGDDVTSINENAFKGVGTDGAGFDVTLNHVGVIGASAFEGSNIVGIDLRNVSEIGASAFQDCAKLIGKYEARRDKNVLYVGAAVIPENAFLDCAGVEIFDFLKSSGITVNDGSIDTGVTGAVVINFYGKLTIAGEEFLTMEYSDPANIVETVSNYTINFADGINNGTVTTATGEFDVTIEDDDFAYTVTKVNVLD